jgi:hypothetical protein
VTDNRKDSILWYAVCGACALFMGIALAAQL